LSTFVDTERQTVKTAKRGGSPKNGTIDGLTVKQAKKLGLEPVRVELPMDMAMALEDVAKERKTTKTALVTSIVAEGIRGRQLPPFLKAELDTLAERAGTSPAECLRRMIESEMDRMKLGKACATVQIRLTPAQYAAALACSIVYAEGDLEKYTQSLVMVGIEGDIDSVASELRASLKESRNEG
jgi:predicted DNA-binding protein